MRRSLLAFVLVAACASPEARDICAWGCLEQALAPGVCDGFGSDQRWVCERVYAKYAWQTVSCPVDDAAGEECEARACVPAFERPGDARCGNLRSFGRVRASAAAAQEPFADLDTFLDGDGAQIAVVAHAGEQWIAAVLGVRAITLLLGTGSVLRTLPLEPNDAIFALFPEEASAAWARVGLRRPALLRGIAMGQSLSNLPGTGLCYAPDTECAGLPDKARVSYTTYSPAVRAEAEIDARACCERHDLDTFCPLDPAARYDADRRLHACLASELSEPGMPPLMKHGQILLAELLEQVLLQAAPVDPARASSCLCGGGAPTALCSEPCKVNACTLDSDARRRVAAFVPSCR